jgi:putative inorganic carbon (HCO3(-)) transporter
VDTLRFPSSLIPPSADRLTPDPNAPAIRSPLRATPVVRSSHAAWDILLICVAGYILMAVGRVHQLFPVLQIVRPALLFGLLAVVLYLIDGSRSRQLNRLWVPTTICLVGFLTWIALSIPGSIYAGNSYELLAQNFIKTVLMYVVIAGSVRGTRDIERLAFVYYLSAVVYAFVVLTRFDIGSGEAWRLGDLYYYDANDFATFAVTALPLGLFFAHAGRRTLTKVFAVLSLIILTVAFVRSGSRGGFLAALALGGYVVLRYSAIAVRWRVGAFVLVAFVFAAAASGQYWRQMGTIVSDTDYNQTEEAGRLQIWSRGIGYMFSHPVFGVGANNFDVAEGTLSPLAVRQQFGRGVRWNAAHNSLVQVGAELGFPGLLFFVAMVVMAFAALAGSKRQRRVSPAFRGRPLELRQALTASLIGFVVGAFFLSLAYHEMLYTLLALAVGMGKVSDAASRSSH